MIEFFDAYPWFLAIAIFLARIGDVSLGTVRTIMVIRGHRYIAAGIGFFEVLIWIVAVSQVMRDLSQWYLMLAYAGGFATGNMVGIWLEGRMAIGLELVRIVSTNLEIKIADALRNSGFSAIEMNGTGDSGRPVEIVFVVERRRKVSQLMRFVESVDPDALCTISDIKRHTMASPMLTAMRRNGVHSAIKKK